MQKSKIKINKCLNIFQDSSKPRILLGGPTNPKLSLAISEYFMNSERPTLFINRAKPAIMFGLNRNPYIECNIKKIKDDRVKLIRQTTYSSCTYVDDGTLMVGFTGKKNQLTKDDTNKIIRDSLNRVLQYPCKLGKNDIKAKIDDKYYKIADKSFKYTDTHYKHNVSILADTDFQATNKYLNPSKGTTHLMNMMDMSKGRKHSKDNSLCSLIQLFLIKGFAEHCQLSNVIINKIDSGTPSFSLPAFLTVSAVNLVDSDMLLSIKKIKDTYDHLDNTECNSR